ncbi:MAG: ATP-binding protein [Cyanobacteria bacterium P01_A01_bin.17]
MEDSLGLKPFSNYRLPIIHPDSFFGRRNIVATVQRSPFSIRILLGGRRIGKSSVLHAIRWYLLSPEENSRLRAFPVFINLQQEQPSSLDNLRYLFIARLREAIDSTKPKGSFWKELQQNRDRWMRQIPEGGIDLFGLTLKVSNPATNRSLIHEDFQQDLIEIIQALQKQNWTGVCFLLDGADFIVNQDWANNAWGYLRALKETINTSIDPFLGIVFSGYRDLKRYQQKVGSPLLGIADVKWIGPLTESETRDLVLNRLRSRNLSVKDSFVDGVIQWAGCHPYLTQQLLNAIIENKKSPKPLRGQAFIHHLIRHQHDSDFSRWWDEKKAVYGFGRTEQSVYLTLTRKRQFTLEGLAAELNLAIGETEDALEVLMGTGVVRQIDFETYQIGSRLFEKWVASEQAPKAK